MGKIICWKKQFYFMNVSSVQVIGNKLSSVLHYIEVPKLNRDDSVCCEGFLAVSECKRAVSKMKKNKLN